MKMRSFGFGGLVLGAFFASSSLTGCAATEVGEGHGSTTSKLLAPQATIRSASSSETKAKYGIVEWRIVRGKKDMFMTGYDKNGKSVKGLSLGFAASEKGDATLHTKVHDGTRFAAVRSFAAKKTVANQSLTQDSDDFVKSALEDATRINAIFKQTQAVAPTASAACGADLSAVVQRTLQCMGGKAGTKAEQAACVAAAKKAAATGTTCKGQGTTSAAASAAASAAKAAAGADNGGDEAKASGGGSASCGCSTGAGSAKAGDKAATDGKAATGGDKPASGDKAAADGKGGTTIYNGPVYNSSGGDINVGNDNSKKDSHDDSSTKVSLDPASIDTPEGENDPAKPDDGSSVYEPKFDESELGLDESSDVDGPATSAIGDDDGDLGEDDFGGGADFGDDDLSDPFEDGASDLDDPFAGGDDVGDVFADADTGAPSFEDDGGFSGDDFSSDFSGEDFGGFESSGADFESSEDFESSGGDF